MNDYIEVNNIETRGESCKTGAISILLKPWICYREQFEGSTATVLKEDECTPCSVSVSFLKRHQEVMDHSIQPNNVTIAHSKESSTESGAKALEDGKFLVGEFSFNYNLVLEDSRYEIIIDIPLNHYQMLGDYIWK